MTAKDTTRIAKTALRARIVELEKERDQLVVQVNERLAYLNGAITELKAAMGEQPATTGAPLGEA